MKVVLTGGCTGGHIYPALAIADKFREHDPDCEILYLGHDDGMERHIVPKYGYPLEFISSKWVDRSNVFKLAETFRVNERGKREAKKRMKEFKPDLVVSTGSFVSVPVVLAAHSLGIPIYIHEQNAYPGMANKLLSRYARKVFLGFRHAGEHFDASKTLYSGNPVRASFGTVSREEARETFDLPKDDFVILVFGGSLGARGMNKIGMEIAREYAGQEGVSVFFGTGKDYYDSVRESLEEEFPENESNIHVMPYISDMVSALAACDIVICRSGALSVAETTVSGRAAIFVPSPNVTGDHQYYNAKEVADQGGAVIVTEDADASEHVLDTLACMKEDLSILREMEESSRKVAPIHATDIIYDTIKEDLAF